MNAKKNTKTTKNKAKTLQMATATEAVGDRFGLETRRAR